MYHDPRIHLIEDRSFRDYFEQETDKLPQFYLDRIKKDLGVNWEWLPKGAVHHDPYIFLKLESPVENLPKSLEKCVETFKT